MTCSMVLISIPTMLRIASMNLLMHGVKNPLVEYRDSLSEGAAGEF